MMKLEEFDFNIYDPLSIRKFIGKSYPKLEEDDIFFLENWRIAIVNKFTFIGWSKIKTIGRKANLIKISKAYCEYLFKWVEHQEDISTIGYPASDINPICDGQRN